MVYNIKIEKWYNNDYGYGMVGVRALSSQKASKQSRSSVQFFSLEKIRLKFVLYIFLKIYFENVGL